jgi:hypothetical protein
MRKNTLYKRKGKDCQPEGDPARRRRRSLVEMDERRRMPERRVSGIPWVAFQNE